MSWTGAFGQACGALLYRIVRGLSLARISPNVYTAIGLVISVCAAVLIVATWPGISLVLLGLLFGINFVSTGMAYIIMSRALKRLP